jgi:hypothetical protein
MQGCGLCEFANNIYPEQTPYRGGSRRRADVGMANPVKTPFTLVRK